MSDVSNVYFPIRFPNFKNYYRLFSTHIAIKPMFYINSCPEISVNKVFLKISQTSRGSTRARVFFDKVAGHDL